MYFNYIATQIDQPTPMDLNEEPFGIKEIAKMAGVSIATVDRVLHNRAGVAEKTKQKINAIIEKFNYQPNILARRLATRKVIQFATVIPHVSDDTSFWSAPLEGILEAEVVLNRYGIKVDKYFFDQDDRESFLKTAAQVVKKKKYDGLLLAPTFVDESAEFGRTCEKLNIPYVCINSDLPDNNSLAYIGPDLFRSGYLVAHLISFLVDDEDSILVVNIARAMTNHHHVLRKEEGFRAYMNEKKKKNEVIKTDIRKTDYSSIRKELSAVLSDKVKVIFVTNSRVSYVARYLEEEGISGILLIGYDFLQQNIEYLEKSTIDFLICQKPQQQAYKGLMSLYNNCVLFSTPEKMQLMPIDIITRENYQFYTN